MKNIMQNSNKVPYQTRQGRYSDFILPLYSPVSNCKGEPITEFINLTPNLLNTPKLRRFL